MSAFANMPPSPAMIINEKIDKIDEKIARFRELEKRRPTTIAEDMAHLQDLLAKAELLRQL